MYVAKPLFFPHALRFSRWVYRCHPVAGETQEVGFVSSLSLQSLWVEYFGQTYAPVPPCFPLAPLMRARTHGLCSAHAGYAPWDGVNALDAAFVAYAGISALRQQIRPEQRVHGVISGRDWAPNGSCLPKTSRFEHAPSTPTRKQKRVSLMFRALLQSFQITQRCRGPSVQKRMTRSSSCTSALCDVLSARFSPPPSRHCDC